MVYAVWILAKPLLVQVAFNFTFENKKITPNNFQKVVISCIIKYKL